MLTVKYFMRTAMIFLAVGGMSASVCFEQSFLEESFYVASFGALLTLTFMWVIDAKKANFGARHMITQIASFACGYAAMYFSHPYVMKLTEALGDKNYLLTFVSIVLIATVFSKHIEMLEARSESEA